MKRIKPGFTLAEVLITLGIIGVVAAIVMPSIMTNYTYKTVGVKLSKFASQLEAATRPYVVQNTSFTSSIPEISAFIEESFLVKNADDFKEETFDCTKKEKSDNEKAVCGATTDKLTFKQFAIATPNKFENSALGTGANFPANSTPIIIKDGTSFLAYPQTHVEQDDINTEQVGEIVFGIAFSPEVKGLPKAVNKVYRFVVTELGYVYPDRANDDCMAKIYDAEFLTTSKTFGTEDNHCSKGHHATGGTGGTGGTGS